MSGRQNEGNDSNVFRQTKSKKRKNKKPPPNKFDTLTPQQKEGLARQHGKPKKSQVIDAKPYRPEDLNHTVNPVTQQESEQTLLNLRLGITQIQPNRQYDDVFNPPAPVGLREPNKSRKTDKEQNDKIPLGVLDDNAKKFIPENNTAFINQPGPSNIPLPTSKPIITVPEAVTLPGTMILNEENPDDFAPIPELSVNDNSDQVIVKDDAKVVDVLGPDVTNVDKETTPVVNLLAFDKQLPDTYKGRKLQRSEMIQMDQHEYQDFVASNNDLERVYNGFTHFIAVAESIQPIYKFYLSGEPIPVNWSSSLEPLFEVFSKFFPITLLYAEEIPDDEFYGRVSTNELFRQLIGQTSISQNASENDKRHVIADIAELLMKMNTGDLYTYNIESLLTDEDVAHSVISHLNESLTMQQLTYIMSNFAAFNQANLALIPSLSFLTRLPTNPADRRKLVKLLDDNSYSWLDDEQVDYQFRDIVRHLAKVTRISDPPPKVDDIPTAETGKLLELEDNIKVDIAKDINVPVNELQNPLVTKAVLGKDLIDIEKTMDFNEITVSIGHYSKQINKNEYNMGNSEKIYGIMYDTSGNVVVEGRNVDEYKDGKVKPDILLYFNIIVVQDMISYPFPMSSIVLDGVDKVYRTAGVSYFSIQSLLISMYDYGRFPPDNYEQYKTCLVFYATGFFVLDDSDFSFRRKVYIETFGNEEPQPIYVTSKQVKSCKYGDFLWRIYEIIENVIKLNDLAAVNICQSILIDRLIKWYDLTAKLEDYPNFRFRQLDYEAEWTALRQFITEQDFVSWIGTQNFPFEAFKMYRQSIMAGMCLSVANSRIMDAIPGSSFETYWSYTLLPIKSESPDHFIFTNLKSIIFLIVAIDFRNA